MAIAFPLYQFVQSREQTDKVNVESGVKMF